MNSVFQEQNQDSNMGGQSLKPKKNYENKTNIYFIFNKILHTK